MNINESIISYIDHNDLNENINDLERQIRCSNIIDAEGNICQNIRHFALCRINNDCEYKNDRCLVKLDLCNEVEYNYLVSEGDVRHSGVITSHEEVTNTYNNKIQSLVSEQEERIRQRYLDYENCFGECADDSYCEMSLDVAFKNCDVKKKCIRVWTEWIL